MATIEIALPGQTVIPSEKESTVAEAEEVSVPFIDTQMLLADSLTLLSRHGMRSRLLRGGTDRSVCVNVGDENKPEYVSVISGRWRGRHTKSRSIRVISDEGTLMLHRGYSGMNASFRRSGWRAVLGYSDANGHLPGFQDTLQSVASRLGEKKLFTNR